jgi:hypothetical protein
VSIKLVPFPSQGQEVATIWGDRPDSVRLDTLFWWWEGMSKSLAAIPLTTNPVVVTAALRLATAYIHQGPLPDDPLACRVFTNFDARTLKKHWPAIKHVLATYFTELPAGRTILVEQKLAKADAGRAGGRAAAARRRRP